MTGTECEICTKAYGFVKSFSRKDALVRHMKTAHPESVEEKSPFACLELDCGSTFGKARFLRAHLTDAHGLSKHHESSSTFQSMDQFLAWKVKIEESTFCQFQRRSNTWKSKDGKTAEIFCCHKTSLGTAWEARCNHQDDNLALRCTAFLKVIQREAEVSVTICLTHFGHLPEDEVHLLKIAKHYREEIANRIASKIPKRHILTELRREARDSFREDGVRRRLMYLTMADLHNIERDHNLTGITVDENEFVSIQAEYERQKAGPDKDRYLVYVKNIGDKCSYVPDMPAEHFIAVIQTDFQRQMLQKIDTKTLCIDSTHGTLHDPDYKLVTLMGLNGTERGIPLAHVIVNHDDTQSATAAFHALKSQLENKEVNFLLSDDVRFYFKGWKTVFPRKVTRHILCIWHVSKNINQTIDRSIKDTTAASEIKKAVRDIMHCPDLPSCKATMKKLTDLCATYPSIWSYLQKNYLNRVDMWMLRSRQGATMTTSGYVENFHRVFKICHLRGRGANRVDELAEILVDYGEPVEQELEVQKLRPTKSFRERQLLLQHKAAMKDSRLFVLQSDNEFRWACSKRHAVTFTETQEDVAAGEYYIIGLVKCPQSNCELQCEGCKPFCAHQLVCNCPSAMGTKTYCKHAHLMGSFLRQKPSTHPYSTGAAVRTAAQVVAPVPELIDAVSEPSDADFVPDDVEVPPESNGSTSLIPSATSDRNHSTQYKRYCKNIQAFMEKMGRDKRGPNLKRLQKVSNLVTNLEIGMRLLKPVGFHPPRKLRPHNSRMKRQSRRHKKHRPKPKRSKFAALPPG